MTHTVSITSCNLNRLDLNQKKIHLTSECLENLPEGVPLQATTHQFNHIMETIFLHFHPSQGHQFFKYESYCMT